MRPSPRARVPALALIALLSAGCFQTTFVNPGVTPGEEHDPWVDFFVFGLAGEADIDVREFCPGEVAMVGYGQNFGTWLVGLFTLGIYTPRKVYVTCAAGAGQPVAFTLDRDAAGRPVALTRTEGSRRFTGVPELVDPALGRYRVALREVRP